MDISESDLIVKAVTSYLQKHKRLDLISEIIEKLKAVVVSETETLEVISAYSLQEGEKEEIKKALVKSFGLPAHIKFTTDKAVLGGIFIKFKDKIVDLTLLGKLSEIEKKLD